MTTSLAWQNASRRSDLASRTSLPLLLAALVAAMIATSSLVMIEPAATDLIFVVLFPVMLVTGQLTIRRDVHVLIYVGLLLFLVGNLISFAFSHAIAVGVRYLAVTVYLALAWWCFVRLIGRYGQPLVDVIVKAYTFAAMVCSIVALLARFDLIPNAQMFMLDDSATRVRSTFKDANVFAPFLVAAVMLTLGICIQRGRVTWFHAGCVSLYSLGVLFAISRGAFINLAVALVTFAALVYMGGVHRRRLTGLVYQLTPFVALLALIATVLMAKADVLDLLTQRTSLQSYDQDRFAVHRQVLAMSVDTPLGIGPRQWRVANHPDIHSLYLRVLLENGWLAFFGWMLFLIGWIAAVYRGAIRPGPFMLYYALAAAVVAGILVESLVIDTLHWRHFFLFLALPIGLLEYEKDQDPQRVADDEPTSWPQGIQPAA